MMLMGLVYISYSSYYVSFGMETVKDFIGASINLLYIFLFFVVVRNSN